jgi:hypothetical protein
VRRTPKEFTGMKIKPLAAVVPGLSALSFNAIAHAGAKARHVGGVAALSTSAEKAVTVRFTVK